MDDRVVSDDEMSVFYKEYLMVHKQEFRNYLIGWWKWHFYILWKQFEFLIKHRT